MSIYLRELLEQDYELIMAWRSDPDIYQGFYTQNKPLTWEEHINWIKSRNKDWRTFIIIYEDIRVGVVTIGQLDHWCPETGFYVGEKIFWGRGIGKEAVRLGLEYIKNYGREYVHTTVLNSNERSIRLLKSLGFECIGEARKGESWYREKL